MIHVFLERSGLTQDCRYVLHAILAHLLNLQVLQNASTVQQAHSQRLRRPVYAPLAQAVHSPTIAPAPVVLHVVQAQLLNLQVLQNASTVQ